MTSINWEKRDVIIAAIAIFAAGAVLGGLAGIFFLRDVPLVAKIVKRDTVEVVRTVVRHDSLPRAEREELQHFYTIRIDSLNNEVHRLQQYAMQPAQPAYDTAAITIPITSRRYYGEYYSAQVSGFHPQLDWINVKHNEILRTITKKVHQRYDNEINVAADVSTQFFGTFKIPAVGITFEWQKGKMSTYVSAGAVYANSTKFYFETGWKWKFFQRKF